MKKMLIGEVARQANITTATIRYYEQIELLPEPRRENGRRLYDDAILVQLRFIRSAQQTGYTLAEIKALQPNQFSHGELIESWKAQAIHKLAELNEKIVQLEQMKKRLQSSLFCTCASMESCLLLAE